MQLGGSFCLVVDPDFLRRATPGPYFLNGSITTAPGFIIPQEPTDLVIPLA